MLKTTEKWDELLETQFKSENYLKLREFLKYEYSNYVVYPSMYDIFNSLKLTDFDDVKVVILGQDPYHEKGQAMGLSFSVPKDCPLPPSLKNIYKELYEELGVKRENGDLTGLAKQGVLLLNTTLTVREHLANSHANKGWEEFTDGIIKTLALIKQNVVYLLWGSNARSKAKFIDKTKNCVLETVHPSPLSAYNGFFGCGHFKKANEYLVQHGLSPVDWGK